MINGVDCYVSYARLFHKIVEKFYFTKKWVENRKKGLQVGSSG